MISSRKNILVVLALLLVLFVGFCTVGCKRKNAWVNTSSMPGKTFSQYVAHDSKGNATIVYLGGENKKQANLNFGPKDVSFDFHDLK